MKLEDTLYEVLEVSPRARTEVIKAAYRCLAQHYHPDKYPDADIANHKLTQINHAYSILSDPVTRLSYDQEMGLHNKTNERRGVRVAADGNFGSGVARHKISRPFGFRPL